MTPAEAVQALLKARERVERATLELEAAKAERKELEEVVLPPLFLQAGLSAVDLPNGARATKSQFSWARLAKPGDPKRQRMIDWLTEVGEQDAIKATVTGIWSRGDYEQAKAAYDQLKQDDSAVVLLEEDVHWKQLERIVLEKVKSGLAVPLSEINATFGDHVTITRNPKDPTL
jgi:hypothetical protein